jgi:hypothetical protein
MVSQSSAPYRHFQNSVKRDVQTIIKKASAILYGQLWLRLDAWALAVQHIVNIDKFMPRTGGMASPLYELEKMTVDQSYTFQYHFGQLVCCSIPKALREGRFSTLQDLGVYVRRVARIKEGGFIYSPFHLRRQEED